MDTLRRKNKQSYENSLLKEKLSLDKAHSRKNSLNNSK